MSIPFRKYHGTGNDFVLIDNRDGKVDPKDEELIRCICTRRFGVGADGLILIREEANYHFAMDYFNADGRLGSMCGNGARCAVTYAQHLGLVEDKAHFLAIDGEHEAVIRDNGEVCLKMGRPVDYQRLGNGDHFIHTGSPHYVKFIEESLDDYPVVEEGRRIRLEKPWAADGTNVNFVQALPTGELRIRTYERGVEDETLSCGTGVTAVAVIYAKLHPGVDRQCIQLLAPGGELKVHIHQDFPPQLEGPASFVFEGEWPG